MKLRLYNGKELTIPNEYLPEERKKRTNHLGYLDLLPMKNGKLKLSSDAKHKLQCYRNHEEHLRGKYKTVYEPLAGVGITAKMFDQGLTWVNDLDRKCYEVLKLNFPHNKVSSLDAGIGFEEKYDLVIADYNDFTIRKFMLGEFSSLLTISTVTDKYLLLNDSTFFFLRYGEDAIKRTANVMGMEFSDIQGYMHALRWLLKQKLGLTLIRTEYWGAAGIHLLERQTEDYGYVTSKVSGIKELPFEVLE